MQKENLVKTKPGVLILLLALFMLITCYTLASAQRLVDNSLPVTEVIAKVIEYDKATCIVDSTFYSHKHITPDNVLLRYYMIKNPNNTFFINRIRGGITGKEFTRMQENYTQASWQIETWEKNMFAESVRFTNQTDTCETYRMLSEPLFSTRNDKALVFQYKGDAEKGFYTIYELQIWREEWKVVNVSFAGIYHKSS